MKKIKFQDESECEKLLKTDSSSTSVLMFYKKNRNLISRIVKHQKSRTHYYFNGEEIPIERIPKKVLNFFHDNEFVINSLLMYANDHELDEMIATKIDLEEAMQILLVYDHIYTQGDAYGGYEEEGTYKRCLAADVIQSLLKEDHGVNHEQEETFRQQESLVEKDELSTTELPYEDLPF